MKILILGGGDSPEREVSLRSAKNVAEAARAAGFEVEEHDPAGGLEFFDSLPADAIIFPILHGAGGEDGELQAEMEKRHLAYLGSDSQASKECFDKWQTRLQLQQAGLKVPKAELVDKASYKESPFSKAPHVLKIVHGGSSIGTLISRQAGNLPDEQLDELFAMEGQAVLEELIIGTEITISILDTSALPVIEIVPPSGAEFDYDNKYNGATQEICPPKSVGQELQKKAQALAEGVHRVMNARHLSRVDIMLDHTGELYVLEINTIPGLTAQSLYPKSAKVAGLDMPSLVTKFVELVKRDFLLTA